jgi:TRAP-type mannitol/chloroaromatic compound transport system permease small subunit
MSTQVKDPRSAARIAEAEAGSRDRHLATSEETPHSVQFAEKLRRIVDLVGRWGSWLVLPVILITCFDVIARKMRYTYDDGTMFSVQYWLSQNTGPFAVMFESTILQELEWHFHAGLFALVLAYGYIWNTHVRVDLVRETLHFRKKAWLEFIGLSVFLIPFVSVLLYFASVYAFDSWAMGEGSTSSVGLPHRFIIKSVLVAGLFMVLVAGVAVWLQVFAVLFGPKDIRYPLMTLEWPEEEGSMIEGKERLDLTKAVDTLEKRARDLGHLDDDLAATPQRGRS